MFQRKLNGAEERHFSLPKRLHASLFNKMRIVLLLLQVLLCCKEYEPSIDRSSGGKIGGALEKALRPWLEAKGFVRDFSRL